MSITSPGVNKISLVREGLFQLISSLPGLLALKGMTFAKIHEPDDIWFVPGQRVIGVCTIDTEWPEEMRIATFHNEPAFMELGIAVKADLPVKPTDSLDRSGRVEDMLGILLGDPSDANPLLRGIRGENIALAFADVVKVYAVKHLTMKSPDNHALNATGPGAACLIVRTTEFSL